nr:hypothetical protein [Syntrophales bacterium]
ASHKSLDITPGLIYFSVDFLRSAMKMTFRIVQINMNCLSLLLGLGLLRLLCHIRRPSFLGDQ